MTTLPEFQIPKISSEDTDDTRGTFVVEPLDKGFGYTYGNSLRRVLLSSLGGAAIKSVRIEGVAHEFSTVPGVKEDVTDIVLNLKDIVIRMHTDADEVEAPLVATGPGEVKAKDIDLPAGVEILNPDAPIATLEKRTKLELYLTIGRGRGYSPAEENKTEDQPIGVIPIDSIFSPIRRASYDGRLGPRRSADRLRQAHARGRDRRLNRARFGRARGGGDPHQDDGDLHRRRPRRGADDPRGSSVDGDGAFAPVLGATEGDDRLIEELEIGVRAYNCLKRAGIQTVGDLVQRSESELNAIPNFGKRSTEEVMESPARARALEPARRAGLATSTSDRHAPRKQRNKLSRDSAHRRALMRNLCREVIEHERITTSQAKAKAVKPKLEKMITLAKRGDLHARRQALAELGQDKFLVHKLFEEDPARGRPADRDHRRGVAAGSSWLGRDADRLRKEHCGPGDSKARSLRTSTTQMVPSSSSV